VAIPVTPCVNAVNLNRLSSMLQCQLLDKPCSKQEQADATETAMCVNKWKKTI